MMRNAQILGNNTDGRHIPRVLTLPGFEVDKSQTNREKNTQMMKNPQVLGKNTGGRAIPSVFTLSGVEVEKAHTNMGKNTQMMKNLKVLGSNTGGRDIPGVLTHSGIEVNNAQTSQEKNTQMMKNPQVLGNNTAGQDIPCVLMLSGIDSSAGTRTETTIYPTLVPNDSKQEDTDSRSFFFTPGYGYLGDPKRNVRILKVHLINAQRKPEPKHAARYLVRVLFSKEVLIRSTVGDNSYLPNPSCHQCLDPNKMAALREYLATAFPNHDLHECGKDWKACISYINSLIRYLCSEAKKTPEKTVVTTKRSTPVSVDLNDKRDGNGGEGSSQLPKQAAASETRASGNSQLNSSAVPKVFKEHCTGNSAVPYGALNYIGHPSRNVQVSYLVLNIAKNKACPQMSARYLIRHLFPKEALLTSSIYGNLWHGLCALNSNRINAIREFLQDTYPACDLSENGRDWKLCVTAMDCYIHTLRENAGI
ncbi:BEN domain-containing protein 2 [Molossus molossus]|uniref:BEN domain-containing protein 2 n=1 Tax=Molossus molossus TaxID=27622 RepID=UPI0017465B9C|nr:BEN domain-containing protein 2 [Molossus molossus]